jgi:two-component system chemotaxis sensor kinase CheA
MSDDIVREFLVESSENLDLLDRELVQLEKNPTKKETLSSIFRTIHTIKGTCGFLGFSNLEGVAHAGENLLSRLRDGELVLRPEITTALLVMVDAIREMLGSIEHKGDDGERVYSELVETLHQLQQSTQTPPLVNTPPPESPAGKQVAQTESKSTTDAHSSTEQAEQAEQPLTKELRAERTEVNAPESASALQSGPTNHASESSIRVDVVLLDKLMNLVGELVLARNQILQFKYYGRHGIWWRPVSD